MSLTSPDAKAVVAAVDRLSTQVRRIADALSTPVGAAQTTADDVPRCVSCGSPAVRYRNYQEQPFCWPCANGEAPAADEDQAQRWARRESLLVLVTRVQRGRPLTGDEARTLREHVETEMREAEAARADVARYEEVQGEINEQAIGLTRRAEIAKTELRTLRDGIRELGGDPTQIQNLWAQLTLTSRQRGEEMARADRAQAALERVRAVAQDWGPTLLPRSEAHRLLTDLRKALDGTGQPIPAATEGTEKTARVFAALHRSAEQDVSRVIDLYERWVKAGPPPIGTPVSRWWDARLVELHDAICPPDGTERSDQTATEPCNGNHTSPSLVVHTASATPPTENA